MVAIFRLTDSIAGPPCAGTTFIPSIALTIFLRIVFKLVVWLAISMLLFALILTVSEIRFKVFGLIALSI